MYECIYCDKAVAVFSFFFPQHELNLRGQKFLQEQIITAYPDKISSSAPDGDAHLLNITESSGGGRAVFMLHPPRLGGDGQARSLCALWALEDNKWLLISITCYRKKVNWS